MALTLPPSPESQLADRVHRMRVARGACWLIAFALLGASALTLLDAAARLPGWVRGFGLAIWLTSFGVLAWFQVVRRWRAKWSRDAASAAKKELPGNVKAAATAALVLIASLLAAVFVPNATEHIRRVALPWYRPAASQYRIVVTSNDPVVRSGSPVTLSAYIEKIDPSAPTPEIATVFCRDSGGNESSISMMGDQTGVFHVTFPAVNADFKYRVEVADATSDWFSVVAIHPVEPTEQTVLVVSPPQYAAGIVPKRTVMGFVPFSGLQHGKVELLLRFSRPATEAFLAWRPDRGVADEVTRLVLSSDKLSGTATLQLKQDGMLRLVTVAEQNGDTLSTSIAVAVRTTIDAPPRFERIKGVSIHPLSIRRGHSLRIELTAVDDIAIGQAAIEYAIGKDDSRPATLSIQLDGSNTPRADGWTDFNLPKELREGETVRYRVRITDTRSLEEPELKPHEVFYPETGWAIVTLSSTAPPIEQQEIEGQRDTVLQGLETASKEVEALAAETQSIRSDTRDGFKVHHKVRLDNASDSQRKIVGILRDVARHVALAPELRSIAAAIQEVADRDLKEAGDNLRNAWTDNATDSGIELTAALKHFTATKDRIDQLKVRNHRLAQARIDCKRIEALIADQLDLANRMKSEPKTSPVKFAEEQQKLGKKLQQLRSESEPLRIALDTVKQKAIFNFASQTSDLAAMLLELDSAIKQLEADVRKDILQGIAADEVVVSANAAVLLARVELAARLTRVNTPKPEEFRRVEALIRSGKTVEGLTELQRLSEALEDVANTFEKWATERGNVKPAIHQFALWQDDLRSRLRKEIDGNDANYNALPLAKKTAFLKEQAAIQAAVDAIVLPPSAELAKARGEALTHAIKAGVCLAGTGVNAEEAMKATIDSLNRLRDKIPTIADRFAKTREEFEKLQKEQESIQKSVEQIINKADVSAAGTVPALAKKLAPLVARQQKQLAEFKVLDLPGVETRRRRILAALASAAADLDSGLPYDVAASQAWVKREFDRMKLMMDGFQPPDERADELARRLEDILLAIETIGPNPTKDQLAIRTFNANEVQEIQRQLFQFNQVTAPEAAALRNDALEAIHVAELRFHDGSKPEELLRRLKLAVMAIKKLSDRMGGAESNLECVYRLSWNRHNAAKNAENVRKEARNPPISDEARRQLSREVEELLFTRVGSAGQLLKQRALEQYDKLKAVNEPDRYAGLQKSLAETLDELAGMMADIAEHTATFDRVSPMPAPTEVDTFLPSKPFAESLRTLARQQHMLRDRLNHLPDEVLKRTQASQSNPFTKPEKKQRELAIEIAAFTDLIATKADRTATDSARRAAMEATRTADLLANGLARKANISAASIAQSLRDLGEFGKETEWVRIVLELAARENTIVEETNDLLDLPDGAATQQRTRTMQLARKANELAELLQRSARERGSDDPVNPVLADAGQALRDVAKLLIEASEKTARGQRTDAEKYRSEGRAAIQDHAGKIAKAAPLTPAISNSAMIATSESLLQAEAAMREASKFLGVNPDLVAAEKAMQAAVSALGKSMADRMRAVE